MAPATGYSRSSAVVVDRRLASSSQARPRITTAAAIPPIIGPLIDEPALAATV